MKLYLLITIICSFVISQSKVKAQNKDFTEKQLRFIQTEFIKRCGLKDFKTAQNFIHPEGLYFYNHGRIIHSSFDEAALEKIANPLYKWGEEYGYFPDENGDSVLFEPKIVTGMFWVDTLKHFTDHQPQMHDNYVPLGYGFSGHYSSNHINEDKILEDHPNTFDEKEIRVLYTEHNTLDGYEVLMIEFYPDADGNWKIYAIGELYWTP